MAVGGGNLKILGYVVLWYSFTISFNVFNKHLLNAVDAPVSVAAAQLCCGVLFCVLPQFLYKGRKTLVDLPYSRWYPAFHKIALLHGFGHLMLVISVSQGSVAFAHVIKAAEPLFACALSYALLNTKISLQAFLALILIVSGVATTVMSDVAFSATSLWTAMISNACNTGRGVLAKRSLNNSSEIKHSDVGHLESMIEDGQMSRNGEVLANISGAALFKSISVIASVQFLLLAILVEGGSFINILFTTEAQGDATMQQMLIYLVLSGISLYMYNEIAFWVLDIVAPTTHAIMNALKRVFIILASVMLLNSPFDEQSMIGGFFAILGTYLYSLAISRN